MKTTRRQLFGLVVGLLVSRGARSTTVLPPLINGTGLLTREQVRMLYFDGPQIAKAVVDQFHSFESRAVFDALERAGRK